MDRSPIRPPNFGRRWSNWPKGEAAPRLSITVRANGAPRLDGGESIGSIGLHRQEHLMARRPKRKRLVREAQPVAELQRANQEWSMDFVADTREPETAFAQLIPSLPKQQSFS